MSVRRPHPTAVAATLLALASLIAAGALYPTSGEGSSLRRADWTLTVTFPSFNTGTGTVTGTGINCPGDCTETYPLNTGVTITAHPNPGSTFTVWHNACEGSAGPCALNGSNSATASPGFTSTGPDPDATPPETTITKAPSKKVKTTKSKAKVKFEFDSSESGGDFECRLDDKSFKSCQSPTELNAKLGKHTLEVQATDAAGNADDSAAKASFKVVKKK